MAIYPLLTSSIINVDVLKASSFKAGMVLVKDSNNRAIKADNQLLSGLSTREKLGRILGFSASDHDINNTIIIPDLIGSSFVDASNQVVYNSNVEYSVPKRGLLDLQDETISKFYNPSDTTITGQKGVGVYNAPGDIFITDQFIPVLHGDYGFDSTTIVSISPGDLLTFGGGVNAGKLVKVNVNSFGPDVLVVGVVEKYIVSTGLLHFRQMNYGLSFTQTDIIYLDPAVSLSYPGSGLTMNDLSTSGYTYDIINGTSFVSAGSASYFNFDGTDDRIRASSVSLSGLNITILAWVWRNGSQGDYVGIVFDRSAVSGLNIAPGTGANLGYHWNNNYFGLDSTITIPNQSWSLVSMAINATSATFGCNGSYNTLNNSHSSTTWTSMTIGSDVPSGSTGRGWNGRIGQAIMLNRTMTNAEITAYFNLTRGRYGV